MDHRLDVGVGQRAQVAGQRGLVGRSGRERAGIAAAHSLLDRGAGAVERAVGGRHALIEGGGRLVGRQPDHVAEQQGRALAGRQDLQGRDEGEATLRLGVARLGS